MLKGKIDKTTPTPFYYQLTQIIKEAINSGDLPVGSLIPTEKEIMKQYDLSRATVRQAILQLVNEGHLRREKGRGTFVTQPAAKIALLDSLRWFSAEMTRKQIPHKTTVLDSGIVPAPDHVAKWLEIRPGVPVFYLKRLRLLHEKPYMIDEHFIPHELCLGIENQNFDDTSLYKTLQEEYNFDLHHGWRELQPIMPSDEEETRLLGIYATTPLLLIECTMYNKGNTPIDYFTTKIRGKFTADIVNAEDF